MEGKKLMVGEAKFWAGLTENQPVTYLRRLIKEDGKVLVVFAPSKRVSTLWAELLIRCKNAKLLLEMVQIDNPDIHIARLQSGQYLVLTSWRSILGFIQNALVVGGDLVMSGNITQIQGLCDRMDSDAFIPIQSEELSPINGRRYMQYKDLVDEIRSTLIARGFARAGGYKNALKLHSYLQYMVMAERPFSIEFNSELWNKHGMTPFWLGFASFGEKDWKLDLDGKQKLGSLVTEQPPRLYQEGEMLFIPMFVKIGVDKQELINDIIDQIQNVISILEPKASSDA
jgi:hypothetical protein